jgi:hypothetical protein
MGQIQMASMISSIPSLSLENAIPCQYIRWQDEIHLFCFTLPSREGVDMWLSQLTTIYEQNKSAAPVLQLLDIRQSGMLPMTHVFNRLQAWIPRHEGSPALYTAVLHNDNTAVNMAQPFIRLLGVERAYKFHFFGSHAQEQAIAWLLNQRVNSKVG